MVHSVPLITIFASGREVPRNAKLQKIIQEIHSYSVTNFQADEHFRHFRLTVSSGPADVDAKWRAEVIERVARCLDSKSEDVKIEIAMQDFRSELLATLLRIKEERLPLGDSIQAKLEKQIGELKKSLPLPASEEEVRRVTDGCVKLLHTLLPYIPRAKRFEALRFLPNEEILVGEALEGVTDLKEEVTDLKVGLFSLQLYHELLRKMRNALKSAESENTDLQQALAPYVEAFRTLDALYRNPKTWGVERLDQFQEKLQGRSDPEAESALRAIELFRREREEVLRLLDRIGVQRYPESERLQRLLTHIQNPHVKEVIEWMRSCEEVHLALYVARQSAQTHPRRYERAQKVHAARLEKLKRAYCRLPIQEIQRAIDSYRGVKRELHQLNLPLVCRGALEFPLPPELEGQTQQFMRFFFAQHHQWVHAQLDPLLAQEFDGLIRGIERARSEEQVQELIKRSYGWVQDLVLGEPRLAPQAERLTEFLKELSPSLPEVAHPRRIAQGLTQFTDPSVFRLLQELQDQLLTLHALENSAHRQEVSPKEALERHRKKVIALVNKFEEWGGLDRLERLKSELYAIQEANPHLEAAVDRALEEITAFKATLHSYQLLLHRVGLAYYSQEPRLRHLLVRNDDPRWKRALEEEGSSLASVRRVVNWVRRCEKAHEALYRAYHTHGEESDAYRRAKKRYDERLKSLQNAYGALPDLQAIQRAMDRYTRLRGLHVYAMRSLNLPSICHQVGRLTFRELPPSEIFNRLGVAKDAEKQQLLVKLVNYRESVANGKPISEVDARRRELYQFIQGIRCRDDLFKAHFVHWLKVEEREEDFRRAGGT